MDKLNNLPEADRLIDMSEVMHLTCMSRSSVYGLAAKNRFPQPINLSLGKSNRCSRWSYLQVQEWISEMTCNSNTRSLNYADKQH